MKALATYCRSTRLHLHGACRVITSALVLGAMLVAPVALGASSPLQGPHDLYLPNVQADLGSGAAGMAVLGQDGIGATVVDAQNRSESANRLTLTLAPISGEPPTKLGLDVNPMQSTRFDLARYPTVMGGYYTGRLAGSEALGGVARVRWDSGATAAYEAAPPAHDFILPLVVRAVYSHTTIIYAQNAHAGSEDNPITMTLYDPADGGVMVETTCVALPDEACAWDTAHAGATFGPDAVGSNAPTGGWLGSATFLSARPAVVMAYGDEMDAQGSSAYSGRPSFEADRIQYLPVLRANYFGDSLIAIANAGPDPVDLTIEYRGAPYSASGAGETIRQEFAIPFRGSAFVDLSERGRGSRPAPDLPRGNQQDGGFVGSAYIQASGPILAAVQDEQLRDGGVDSVSAYNAFGPRDLGSEFSATSVRRQWDYQSSSILVYNPGYETIVVTADLYDGSDRHVGQVTSQIPELSVERIALADEGTLPVGVGRAYLKGTGAFAALVYDERDSRGEPLEKKTSAYLSTIGDSHVSGGARLVETGNTLRVDIDLSWTYEGSTYFASIVSGSCDGEMTEAHKLNDFEDKKSSSVLQNVKIEELTTTVHSVLVKVAGFRGRPPRDVACGEIQPIAGAEVVDTTLSWPVRMVKGAPIASPSPQTPTATRAATGAPPATVTPRTPPANLPWQAFLPIAYKQ